MIEGGRENAARVSVLGMERGVACVSQWSLPPLLSLGAPQLLTGRQRAGEGACAVH